MRAVWLLPLLLLSGACGASSSADESEADVARDIALVEQANSALPPLREVTPDPILAPDMEQHDLYGQACNYAPGTSFGTRVIAREGDAFVKIEGEVQRFAADPGSRELPARSRSLYDGREYSLRLAVEKEDEEDSEIALSSAERTNYEGTVSLRDRWGRVVYQGTGLVQCGA